jgi:tetratricopeptide (TPR) repeat protein
MRRNPHAQPTLKHLAFFEAVGASPEGSPEANAATAGLLVLRLIDHWTMIGAPMVDPDSVSIASSRAAIMEMPALDPQREVLLGIVNTLQALRDVELAPVLPRLQAYATLLERRTLNALALDVYETIVRFTQDGYEVEAQYDALMRIGHCQTQMAELDAAESTYKQVIALSKRMKSPERTLRARMSATVVPFMRGNFPRVHLDFDAIDAELQGARLAEDARAELQGTLHFARSSLAVRERNMDTALHHAHRALRTHRSTVERERTLGQIAMILLTAERWEAARAALTIVDLTTIREETRTVARANLHSLAARTGDRALFDHMLAQLDGRELPAQVQANVLIESARGFRVFGEPARADELLREAREFALAHQLNRSVFECDELIAGREPFPLPESGTPTLEPGLRDQVESELKDELAQLVRH